MYFSSRLKNRTYLCVTANYPVSCKPVQGRERKFAEIWVYLSPWYHVSTKAMFIPKVATGMESPKMHSSTRCKNRTYLCGTANYPVSCKAIQGHERKFVEIRVYLSPCYRICTKAMFISKGSYRYGELKNSFL